MLQILLQTHRIQPCFRLCFRLCFSTYWRVLQLNIIAVLQNRDIAHNSEYLAQGLKNLYHWRSDQILSSISIWCIFVLFHVWVIKLVEKVKMWISTCLCFCSSSFSSVVVSECETCSQFIHTREDHPLEERLVCLTPVSHMIRTSFYIHKQL